MLSFYMSHLSPRFFLVLFKALVHTKLKPSMNKIVGGLASTLEEGIMQEVPSELP